MHSTSRRTSRFAGSLYLVASIGFLLVFSWLAARFGYPDILDRPAADVLPALRALGPTGRAVWAVYAVLPLLLIPAALTSEAALAAAAPRRLRAATVLQTLAAVAMLLGLARWPSVQWRLAEAWPTADGPSRLLLTAAFDAANMYLGNWIGEFTGEVMLYAAFLLIGSALRQHARASGWRFARWIGGLGLVAGVTGEIAAFRNVTTLVAPAAEAANLLLPAFLVGYGVLLWRGAGTVTVHPTTEGA